VVSIFLAKTMRLCNMFIINNLRLIRVLP
jgi:hypothetical protein